MKIYKTWNEVIANYLPIFKNQDFIVFKPETEEEKDFLFNFFNIFLTDFVKELDKSFEEVQKFNKNFQINRSLKKLVQTNKFYLVTSLEEYIVPRDSFIELIKLVKEMFLLSINNKSVIRNAEKKLKAFNIVSNCIELNTDTENIANINNDKEKKVKIEKEIIDFIDKNILSKFAKKRNNSNWN